MTFNVFYICFLVVYVLYEVFSERKLKKHTLKTKIEYKSSYFIMAGVYLLLLFFSILEHFFLPQKAFLSINFLGLIIFLIGIRGRYLSIKALGKYWCLHIGLKKGHILIKEGIYKYLRHPNYLSVIFKGIGFTIFSNAYYTFIFSILVYIPVIIRRMEQEEKVLVKNFGKEYLDYKQQVWALCPLSLWKTKIKTFTNKKIKSG